MWLKTWHCWKVHCASPTDLCVCACLCMRERVYVFVRAYEFVCYEEGKCHNRTAYQNDTAYRPFIHPHRVENIDVLSYRNWMLLDQQHKQFVLNINRVLMVLCGAAIKQYLTRRFRVYTKYFFYFGATNNLNANNLCVFGVQSFFAHFITLC